jgi:hypothetical protein
MHAKKKLAVAMTAMSLAGTVGEIGAAEARAQSEVLQGTATTISGQAAGVCGSPLSKSVSAKFDAAGPASGPYSGAFTETNATGGVSGWQRPLYEQLRVSIPFTIGSGTTTITGTITNPYPWVGGSFICNGSALVGFTMGAYANNATYTATIERPGQLPQTISGNAQLRGNFYIQPGGDTTVTETLAFP